MRKSGFLASWQPRAQSRFPALSRSPGLPAALAYGVSGAFALAVVLVSNQAPHRLWGACAAVAYGVAALVSRRRASRRRGLALTVAMAGAVAVPLCWLAAAGQGMPEVTVVAHSAELLVSHGRPYQSAAALGTDVYGYNPYLPGMTLFGLPRALFGGGLLTDPRLADALAFAAAFAASLLITGARPAASLRRTALVTASPLIAFPLAVSGNDLPVIGLLCLGLGLALATQPPPAPPPAASGRPSACDRGSLPAPAASVWPVLPRPPHPAWAVLPRPPHPAWAGVALGAAAALKATAWPALLIVGVLFLARDGRGAASRFAGAAAAVLAAIVGPFLLIQPRDLVANTIDFPLGLTSAHSPATSPLPGHLIAATGTAGHAAVMALMAAGLAGVGVMLVIRPPRTAAAAAGYLALTLTILFTLAPATRWGYFTYPLGIISWLCLSAPRCRRPRCRRPRCRRPRPRRRALRGHARP